MGIKSIEIENYKSIKKCTLDFLQLNALIGANGSGKSNILSAIKYFYDNLINEQDDNSIFDKNNKFNNKVKISITYDFSILNKRSYMQLQKAESRYKNYYKKIAQISEKDQCRLTLTKIKNKKMEWDKDLNTRKMIYNLFPLYEIDARNIDLIDWGNVWQQIGDLVKIENTIEEELQGKVNSLINEKGYELKDIFLELDNIFKNYNLKIKSFTPKQFGSSLANVFFNGKDFEFKETKLEFFSTGTNAYNYTGLLIAILGLIANKKMKIPIILLDEPETSLHHKLVDELTNQIFDHCEIVQFIISTHSPRLIKNVLKEENSNCNIYHLKLTDQYTLSNKMKLFDIQKEGRNKIFITDQHSNAYFSKVIVCVEGESEFELLNNKFLVHLYPILNYVDIMPGMANDVIKSIISPTYRKYNVPIISLCDMDKIFNINPKTNKVSLYNNINRYKESEKYYYRHLRSNTLYLRKRIIRIAEKCRFHYKLPFYSCEDENYVEFINLIKKYFLNYNIYIASTTIEGILITEKNKDLFWNFTIEKMRKNKEFDKLVNLYYSFNEANKLQLLRLLYNGKSDYCFTLKQIEKSNPNMYSFIPEIIKNNRIKKTYGWISEWIEYYICDVLDIDKEVDKFKQFKSKIEKKVELEKLSSRFDNDFRELVVFINVIKQSN